MRAEPPLPCSLMTESPFGQPDCRHRVNYFIRASFAAGRADCLSLLFCGKLDIFDIPALCELYELGLCRPPCFLPPWVSDPHYLLALLTFSHYTNRLSMEPIVEVAQRLLESAPVVRMPEPGEVV